MGTTGRQSKRKGWDRGQSRKNELIILHLKSVSIKSLSVPNNNHNLCNIINTFLMNKHKRPQNDLFKFTETEGVS